MWTCPTCKRTFKNPNQAHSCVIVDPQSLLANSNTEVIKIYAKVERIVKAFGGLQINASNSTINFKNGATFLVLKPKKDRMELEFVLPEEKDEFPVYKTFRISKSRVAHYIVLQKAEELDSQVEAWLKTAYDTVGG